LASISDNYANEISVGMPVLVRINNTDVAGTLTNIHPSIANNVITFDVALTEKNASELRPKMKVEVYLVTDRRAQTLRVANGPAFKGGSELDLFVLRPDGIAERRKVKTGLVNFDYVEILEGISIGEKVIISDMSKYKNSTEIKVSL
jgi:HlyD family secretion protein